MVGDPNAQRLRGRRDECHALDRLLDAARAGQSSVLVLRALVETAALQDAPHQM
jgi:hypothetical protein